MAGDAADLQVGQIARAAVERGRGIEGDAELGALQSRGDVGMGLRIDVRIDAQGDRRALGQLAGNRIQVVEFAGRFDVEAVNAGFQRLPHFGPRLADAGKHDLAGVAAGGEDPSQLAARNDIEAGAEPSEQAEDREVRVGLDGVADACRQACQGLAVRSIGGRQCGMGVHVARRAVTCGDGGQGRSLDARRGRWIVDQAHWSFVAGALL